MASERESRQCTVFWARICKNLWSPGIDSEESLSHSLCSLAGQYDKYGPAGWESILGLLKRSTNTGSVLYCICPNSQPFSWDVQHILISTRCKNVFLIDNTPLSFHDSALLEIRFSIANNWSRKHRIFKGLSKDGGWVDIAKYLRTSSFNEGLPINTISATLQGKSHLCIPSLGIARPQSQFPQSCVCERFYVFPGLVHIFPCSRIGRPNLEIYKSLTEIEWRNWETEHYNTVLEITVSFL
jgi:hypothetical protein